jgi:hypothetical protein
MARRSELSRCYMARRRTNANPPKANNAKEHGSGTVTA